MRPNRGHSKGLGEIVLFSIMAAQKTGVAVFARNSLASKKFRAATRFNNLASVTTPIVIRPTELQGAGGSHADCLGSAKVLQLEGVLKTLNKNPVMLTKISMLDFMNTKSGKKILK